jgi:hypothetical protein
MNLLNHAVNVMLAENDTHSERLRRTMRQPNVTADILVDIISVSTREKDGGQFHNIEDGRHQW